jgi:EmrB/QacA subfamily drug resistance transporter
MRTLALLTTATLSLALMQTLVVPALPSFQQEFGADASWTTWIVTGFLLSSSVLTPIVGKLGDAHGKKRAMVVSLLIFAAASLGAALAWSLPALVGFRVLQGVGAAVFPLSFGIIRDEFPPEKVAFAVGTVSSAFGLGGGFGLVLSGAILEQLGWEWLFVLGSLPALVAAALIHRWVPESPQRTPGRADWRGAALLSMALVALLVALSETARWGWGSPGVLGLAALSVWLLAAWVRVERRTPDPLIDLTTLTRRGMAATNAATFMLGFAMTAVFVLMPSFLERGDYGFGASVTHAGLLLLPLSLGMVLTGPAAGALVGRVGPVAPLRAGLALAAGALALLAGVHEHVWMVCAWLALLGAAMATALAGAGTLVLKHSTPEETGVASGMNSIMRTIGASLGAQIAATTVSSIPLEHGFTVALAIAAAGAAAGLLPTLLLGDRSRKGPHAVTFARPATRSA